jgi:hypothetical protein
VSLDTDDILLTDSGKIPYILLDQGTTDTAINEWWYVGRFIPNDLNISINIELNYAHATTSNSIYGSTDLQHGILYINIQIGFDVSNTLIINYKNDGDSLFYSDTSVTSSSVSPIRCVCYNSSTDTLENISADTSYFQLFVKKPYRSQGSYMSIDVSRSTDFTLVNSVIPYVGLTALGIYLGVQKFVMWTDYKTIKYITLSQTAVGTSISLNINSGSIGATKILSSMMKFVNGIIYQSHNTYLSGDSITVSSGAFSCTADATIDVTVIYIT